MHNGMVKVITGLKRCGKSFLLDPLFKDYLLSTGVPRDKIIKIDLSDISNQDLTNPLLINEKIGHLFLSFVPFFVCFSNFSFVLLFKIYTI